MKKTIWFIIIILFIVGFCYFIYPQKSAINIKGWTATNDAIIGSQSNLKTLPSSAVFKPATTTPATGEYGMNDGSATVEQDVTTLNVDKVKLFVSAKGDTATSTMFIRQMVSVDNTNYFDIATSSIDRTMATTTIGDALLAMQWDPGTATTSKVFEFETIGFPYSRFIVWSENLTTDPNDGVQAYIKAIKVDTK